LYAQNNGQCGCIESSYELDLSFTYEKNCTCTLDKPCSKTGEWQVLAVSHVIDLIDTEVGM
jgi:hypothetical protein